MASPFTLTEFMRQAERATSAVKPTTPTETVTEQTTTRTARLCAGLGLASTAQILSDAGFLGKEVPLEVFVAATQLELDRMTSRGHVGAKVQYAA